MTIITTCLLTISAIASLLLLSRTIWALNRFKYEPKPYQHSDLPSVSVCIAARNEMHALAQCLERVLQSDYAKLEVLVLDDSSDDNTSLIIKSFAGAGVRFIAGKPLQAGWLGKNHAYQTLIEEASGDVILFLDVDTTIVPTTISQLVSYMGVKQVSMISVLPRREDSYRLSAMFGTLRYHWELLLARWDSPPTASALWMIERERLIDPRVRLESYAMSVRLEHHIARQLQRENQYECIVGTKSLGVGYEKHLSTQHETAERLYYVMTGKSFIASFSAILFLAALLTPFAVLSASPGVLNSIIAALCAITTTIAFRLYIAATYGSIARQLRLLVWPLVVLYEPLLVAHSYFVYKVGIVTWKGRLVNARSTKQDDLRIDE